MIYASLIFKPRLSMYNNILSAREMCFIEIANVINNELRIQACAK